MALVKRIEDLESIALKLPKDFDKDIHCALSIKNNIVLIDSEYEKTIMSHYVYCGVKVDYIIKTKL